MPQTDANEVDYRDEEREIPADEEALVKRFQKEIKDRIESAEWKQFLADIDTNRKYARGSQHDDGEGGLVRANLIHSELKNAQNECYAKDPDFSVDPKESVSKDSYETWKAVGKTLELVLRHEYSPEQGNLKAKAKRSVRSADTTGFGWLKIVYQKHIERDPIVVERLDDVQDNIQELDRLIAELQSMDGQEGIEQHESRREELRQQEKSLMERVEVVRSEGLNPVVRPGENVVFSDEVVDVEDIGRAAWIVDQIWMTEDRFKARFGFCPKEASRYTKRTPEMGKGNSKGERKGGDKALLLRVIERWNYADKRIYTMVEGYNGYVREPYSPRDVGRRFHAFFPLVFDRVDGSAIPLPLVTQLRELQDEHNTARTNFKEHRERSVPFQVAHGGELDPTDTDKLTNPKFMETVVIRSLAQGIPLEQAFKEVRHQPIDPQVYDTNHIRVDWEQVTRRGDASRGTVSRAKTATEAEILQSSLAVDTSERRDVVEDWFRDIAQYSAEVLLQEMSVEQVKKIAGEGAAWPQLTKNEVFEMVSLKVRAGSSGKPNAGKELEKWIKLLPQLRESLLAIMEMRANGKDKEADVMAWLLRETVERFQEKIDINALLPETNPQEQNAEQMQRMQQQQQEFALQMKDMLSTIANRDADTMKKIAEAEAKEVGPQMQIYMTILQGLLNNNQQASGSVQ